MTAAGSSVINRIFCTFASKIAAYRMINNENVSCSSIIEAYRNTRLSTVSRNECKHVLCLQDTCEINYEAHSQRMRKNGRKPGLVSNEEVGCFLHPTLAIDAETFAPCGFTSIKMWSRKAERLTCRQHNYKKVAPEEKESYRWSESIDNTKELLGKATMITVLSDRESDVYETLKRADSDVRIIVRSNQNRRIKGVGDKLHDRMRELPSMGGYQLMIPASNGAKSRTAVMEIRYASVELERPAGTKAEYDANVRLNCIRVSEINDSVPHGSKPVEWVLLTNHEVTSVEQALQCVNWYKCRWFIEELFRLLKKKGFAIEDIQLEDTECLEKNILFAAYAAMCCITMKHAFDHPEHYSKVPAGCCFSQDEISAAKVLSKKLEGKTKKLKNPFTAGSLSWLAWIIARLGCWSGYFSQPRPGYTTFKAGLDYFNKSCDMYRIMKDVYNG